MIGIAGEGDVLVSAKVERRKAVVDPFGPLYGAVDRTELVAGDRHAVQEMPAAAGFHDDIAEPTRRVAAKTDVVRDAQRAEGKTADEIRLGIVFVGPFYRTVIDVIRGDRAAVVAAGKHDSGAADAVRHGVTLKEVIARDDMVRTAEYGEMAETRGPVVPQLDIVGIAVKCDGNPIFDILGILIRQELAVVDQHPLTAASDRGDAAIHRARDHAAAQAEDAAAGRQAQGAAIAVALQFDIAEFEFRQ